ncbi:hypothetical protein LX32DRAFT_115654 [Colletotrichum zoysiae]|uniref:Uncharacterized protein n=1 Tax=Colletotrichum zoysiae TaxID=1216348 RepID=A0AAD9H8E2_9PEZI|nr:hypothetical protein LX32DRAFT_115654 [Colletotrichum zoysiae]
MALTGQVPALQTTYVHTHMHGHNYICMYMHIDIYIYSGLMGGCTCSWVLKKGRQTQLPVSARMCVYARVFQTQNCTQGFPLHDSFPALPLEFSRVSRGQQRGVVSPMKTEPPPGKRNGCFNHGILPLPNHLLGPARGSLPSSLSPTHPPPPPPARCRSRPPAQNSHTHTHIPLRLPAAGIGPLHPRGGRQAGRLQVKRAVRHGAAPPKGVFPARFCFYAATVSLPSHPAGVTQPRDIVTRISLAVTVRNHDCAAAVDRLRACDGTFLGWRDVTRVRVVLCTAATR